MPDDRTLLSLESHAIPARVLRFEDSGLHRRTPVRLVLVTGQTGTHRSDRLDRSGQTSQTHRLDRLELLQHRLRSWLCGSTKEPSGFLVNHWKPRELGVASTNRHS
jgi:hypothetical protein